MTRGTQTDMAFCVPLAPEEVRVPKHGLRVGHYNCNPQGAEDQQTMA